MIRAVPAVAAMASYALADPCDPALVSLAQNESALAPSPKAIAAGQKALDHSQLYPDPDWSALRRALASLHGLNADTILCGAGSMDLIGCLIRAYAGPGDEVLGSQFGYLFASSAAQQAGAQYVTAAEAGYTVCMDTVLAQVTRQTRIVFLCNPGNPTGTRLPNAAFLRLRAELPADVLLVIDQAYAEFDDQDHAAIFDLVRRGDTVVTRTLSKAYGLAGARVGWGVFPPPVAAEMRKLLNPNNVSGVSQAMAQAAVADQAHMRRVVTETARVRDAFAARLAAAGYVLPESVTNFVLIPFASVAEARRADAQLQQQGYVLRGMGGYGLPHCLRATIGTERHMQDVARILEDLR